MNPPSSIRGKRLKLYYVTQVKAAPPTFVLFINNEDLLKDNYVKYLGHTYESLTLKKIQIIINELRFRLFAIKEKNQQQLHYLDEDVNRGRRGR